MEFGTREMPPKKGSGSQPLGRRDATGPQSGEVLQGRYMILGTLGVGGFSSVYRARDLRFPSVTRLCAVKEMVISTDDPEMRQLTIKSFEREAGMLATLNHPAIPDIYDYFTDGNRSYLVLEFVPGQNLQQWLDETDEYLDEQKALDWALQVCDALAYLHSQKPQPVIFRDLKPSNIMLDPYNHIRLIDFGIAKLFEASEDKGTMIGTAGYTPPEQYRGEATPAVDVYGLGATIHHLLTRQDPRQETPFTFSERPIRAANPGISRAFEAIIMRCLAYDPKDRFPDAMALREALLVLSRSDGDDVDLDQRLGLGLKESGRGFDAADTGMPAATLRAGLSQIKPLWAFRCEDEIRSRPSVAKGIVFVGAYDNNLYALTADKGDFLWKFPTGGGVGGSPIVSEDAVLIGSSDHSLYSLQLRKGRLNWQFTAEGSIYSSPAVRFDHAFFGAVLGQECVGFGLVARGNIFLLGFHPLGMPFLKLLHRGTDLFLRHAERVAAEALAHPAHQRIGIDLQAVTAELAANRHSKPVAHALLVRFEGCRLGSGLRWLGIAASPQGKQRKAEKHGQRERTAHGEILCMDRAGEETRHDTRAPGSPLRIRTRPRPANRRGVAPPRIRLPANAGSRQSRCPPAWRARRSG